MQVCTCVLGTPTHTQTYWMFISGSQSFNQASEGHLVQGGCLCVLGDHSLWYWTGDSTIMTHQVSVKVCVKESNNQRKRKNNKLERKNERKDLWKNGWMGTWIMDGYMDDGWIGIWIMNGWIWIMDKLMAGRIDGLMNDCLTKASIARWINIWVCLCVKWWMAAEIPKLM